MICVTNRASLLGRLFTGGLTGMTELKVSKDDVLAQCQEMGKLLGLDGPVDVRVLIAATENPTYAHNLLATRREPRYLQRLLDNPPALKTDQPSLGQLAKNAASSLARWAQAGFSTVDSETYEGRMAACSQCNYLTVPATGRKLLYTVAQRSSEEGAICARCGCLVKSKARRPSDTCPEPDPQRPGQNLWGEPLKT